METTRAVIRGPVDGRAPSVGQALFAERGPFARVEGILDAEEGDAVIVPAPALAGWAGWRFAGAEHVAAPADLVHGRDGSGAVLPRCQRPLEPYLRARADRGEPLAPGEAVTLVVSLLRGLGELRSAAGEHRGAWWLSGRGRPLFVLDGAAGALPVAGEEAERATRALLALLREEVRDDRALRRLLREAEDGCGNDASAARIERELFEHAAARPLVAIEDADGTVPERPGTAPGAAGQSRLPARWRRSRRRGSTARSPARQEPEEDGRRPPRRLWVAGGTLVAALALGLLLWPPGDEGRAGESLGETALEEAGDAPASVITADPAPPDADADPLRALPAVLQALRDCAEHLGSSGPESDAIAEAGDCPDVIAPGSRIGLRGALLRAPDRTAPDGSETEEAQLLDDYGGVVVLRLGDDPAAGDGTGQILVIIRADDRWLVRDVYDVADQPA